MKVKLDQSVSKTPVERVRVLRIQEEVLGRGTVLVFEEFTSM